MAFLEEPSFNIIFYEHVQYVLYQLLLKMTKDVKLHVVQLQSLKYICFQTIK